MTLSFEKLVGAGNDFVFLSSHPQLSAERLPELTKKLCDRNEGIGADGLVVLEEKTSGNYLWHFFNSDGSSAEMCGNAARCAFLFIQNHFQKTSGKMETLCGTVSGEVLGPNWVEVSWQIADEALKEITLTLESGRLVQGFYINTGVPHFVLYNPEDLTHNELLEIQQHSEFGPAQTNVTVMNTNEEINKTKTFERGVRDFTLACGTGVIASAFVLQHYKKNDKYLLRAPGGELTVRLDDRSVYLTGPARSVFKGEIQLD